MTREHARLVVSSGDSFSAPLRNLSVRSVFVEGRVSLSFGEMVTAVLLGHSVEARVAFVASDPPGVVLTFEATPELVEAIKVRDSTKNEEWGDEDVTGTHDREDTLLASMVARAAAASAQEPDVDSEEPTNTGSRALGDEETTPAAIPAVYVDGQVVASSEEVGDGLSQQAGEQEEDEGKSKRLRATTQVSEPATAPSGEAD